MPTTEKAMCLTVTPANDIIILEYISPVPQRMPADWDKFIRRQRVAGKPKTLMVSKSEKYYNDVLNFQHGDKFLIENNRVVLGPTPEIEIPFGEYDISRFKAPTR